MHRHENKHLLSEEISCLQPFPQHWPFSLWCRIGKNILCTSNCVASSETWKGQAKCRLCPPWKHFCGRPWSRPNICGPWRMWSKNLWNEEFRLHAARSPLETQKVHVTGTEITDRRKSLLVRSYIDYEALCCSEAKIMEWFSAFMYLPLTSYLRFSDQICFFGESICLFS